MQTQSRIPQLTETTFDGAYEWFTEMANRDLQFHPEDDPAQIFVIATGERTFTPIEVDEINAVFDQLGDTIGSDMIMDAAYKVLLKTLDWPVDGNGEPLDYQ